jgi:hypothetical protein
MSHSFTINFLLAICLAYSGVCCADAGYRAHTNENSPLKKDRKIKFIQQPGKEIIDTQPMLPEQRKYLDSTIKILIRYMANEVTLTEVEAIVGTPHLFYPKDPKKPILMMYFDPTKVDGIFGVDILRKNQVSPWTRAEVSFQGERTPNYAYLVLNLKKYYFNNYDLISTEKYTDKRQKEEKYQREMYRFSYRPKEAKQKNVKIDFIADIGFADPKDGYPRNFSEVHIFLE